MSYWNQSMRLRKEQAKKRVSGKMKKRQLMRESDFAKLPKSLLANYDVSFRPFTRMYFQKYSTWFYLKDKKYIGDQYALFDYPQHLLKRLTGVHWFDRNQSEYLYKYNEEGELVVRAGLRQPESRFGLATFRERKNNASI